MKIKGIFLLKFNKILFQIYGDVTKVIKVVYVSSFFRGFILRSGFNFLRLVFCVLIFVKFLLLLRGLKDNKT